MHEPCGALCIRTVRTAAHCVLQGRVARYVYGRRPRVRRVLISAVMHFGDNALGALYGQSDAQVAASLREVDEFKLLMRKLRPIWESYEAEFGESPPEGADG